MKLLYDNFVYDLQRIGGISSYWYELTKRFLADPETDIRFYESLRPNHNILRKMLEIDPENIMTSHSKQLLLERFKRLKTPDFDNQTIFHSSYFRVPERGSNVRKVCTIHDFTHDLYFKGPRVFLHNVIKKRAITESDAIITVSENTKKDLLYFYPGIDEKKVHVIHNGVSDEFKDLKVKVKNELIYVGSRDNYKNFDFVVKLVSKLKNYHLNIVGSALSKDELELVKTNLKKRYTVFTNVSIEKLNQLYNRSMCLLYLSSYEGFGIPLLEAMRAGCPFVALDASSIPEVAGDAGILLPDLDIGLAVEAVKTISAKRNLYTKKGETQSLKFSWDRCYAETRDLYKNLL
ncbi:glycosyltransferase family 4 protein [Pedobacter antarcticus]|uniref:glycosyltransferase family 4 protein n=1 Tax=Pedobacter antarcticus TaxID=34086 RepID=UPI001C572BC9|nr:glycosyltransferase family 1 protein [Pedobacter antarcticus]